MDNAWLWLLGIPYSILLAVLLYRLNYRRKAERHKQFPFVLTAAFLILPALVVFFLLGAIEDGFFREVEGFLAFSIAASFLYLILKGLLRLFLKKPWNSVFYESAGKTFVLRKEWSFLPKALRPIHWLVFSAALLSFCFPVLDANNLELAHWLFSSPGFLLVWLPLVELYWHLVPRNAEQTSKVKSVEIGGAQGDRVESKFVGEYHELWKKYLEIWEEKYLVAWREKNRVLQDEDRYFQKYSHFTNLKKLGYAFQSEDKRLLDSFQNRQDLLVERVIYPGKAPLLFMEVSSRLFYGETLLVLLPKPFNPHQQAQFKAYRERIEEVLYNVSGATFSSCFFQAGVGKVEAPIILSNAEDLLRIGLQDNLPWFKRLSTVLLIDLDEIFSRSINNINALTYLLRRINPDVQMIGLSEYQHDLQPAAMRNLFVRKDTAEVNLRNFSPTDFFAICWKTEGHPSFQETLFLELLGRDMGAEPVLSLLACRDGVRPVRIIDWGSKPYEEMIEELMNQYDQIRYEFLGELDIYQNMEEYIRPESNYNLIGRKERQFFIVQDRDQNLITTLIKWRYRSESLGFVNVVSQPYLLRDYLAANMGYFLSAPSAIYPYGQHMMESHFQIAYRLLYRLVRKGLSEEELREELKSVNDTLLYPKIVLRELFLGSFGIDVVRRNYLEITQKEYLHPDGTGFRQSYFYALNERILEDIRLQFLKYVQIKSGDQHLGVEMYDFLFQHYLPGQVHNFYGKSYRVNKYYPEANVLDCTMVNTLLPFKYRNHLRILVPEDADLDFAISRVQKSFHFEIAQLEHAFGVQTLGYFANTGIFSQEEAKYFALGEIPERNYPAGRLMRFSLPVPVHLAERWDTERKARGEIALALLFQEILPTIYPSAAPLLVVAIRELAPVLNGASGSQFPPCLTQVQGIEREGKDLQLFFFEDAHQDLGLVQSLANNMEHHIQVIYDFLVWSSEEYQEIDPENVGNAKTIPYNWLEFRPYKKQDTPLIDQLFELSAHSVGWEDLHLLTELLGCIKDVQELTGARRSYYQYNEKLEPWIGTNRCDFCCQTLPPVEYETLSDGRKRCDTCRGNAVKEAEELLEVYREALNYIEGTFERKLATDVKVTFTDAKNLHENLGLEFVPNPEGCTPRAVGIAKSNHEIYLETGAPYHSLLCTSVHELTHIWQYENLDMARLRKEHGLMLIEGHTTWMEYQILAEKKIAPTYQKSLLKRTDEYGQGLRFWLDFLKRNKNFASPFEYLKQHYSGNGKNGEITK